MTTFDDRVIFKLDGSLPIFPLPSDAVKAIWGFEDGKWAPNGFTAHGNSYLTLADDNNNPPDIPLNLFAYTIAYTGGEPLLGIDRGVTVQKDLTAGGFVGSNQGELWLGSGRANQIDIPKIILMHSDMSMLNGGGWLNAPGVPAGHSGSSFPYNQPSGTYFLYYDGSQYKLYKCAGNNNWTDTTPTNTDASQLFISLDAILGQSANTIFQSAFNGTTWTWASVGSASDYAGKYFDTLYLRKFDLSPGHLDLGDLTAHGKVTLKSGQDSYGVLNFFDATHQILFEGVGPSSSTALLIGYKSTGGTLEANPQFYMTVDGTMYFGAGGAATCDPS